jgi:hypothetical protein
LRIVSAMLFFIFGNDDAASRKKGLMFTRRLDRSIGQAVFCLKGSGNEPHLKR